MARKPKSRTVRTSTKKNQELCLLFAVLAALIMVAGLSLASYMVVGMEKEWSSVTPVFGMFFTCSIVLFVVSSYLTKTELDALRKAGMLGGGGQMEISRTIQTTIGMLILTLLLLVGGAYLLITQGQDLERLRDELAAAERRKGEVERSLQAISMQLVDIRSKMNQARAGTIYLVDAMEASQDFLDDQGTRVRLLCEQTSGGENADPTRSTRSEGDGLNLGSHSDDADFISFAALLRRSRLAQGFERSRDTAGNRGQAR